MSRTPNETREALELLSNGATRGMAINQLVTQGLSTHLAEVSVENAAIAFNRKARMFSVFVAIGGLLLTAIGGAWLYYRMINGHGAYAFPITILGNGVMILMYGSYGATRDRI